MFSVYSYFEIKIFRHKIILKMIKILINIVFNVIDSIIFIKLKYALCNILYDRFYIIIITIT